MDGSTNDQELVLSAIGLRKLIGWLGVLLPLLCLFWACASQSEVLGSISAYYFTRVHGFFTGILCGLGVCLFTYRGFSRLERNLAMFGGACAAGVAICPTAASSAPIADEEAVEGVVSLFVGPLAGQAAFLHGLFASLLFIVFMVFAGALFTRSHASDENDPLTVKSIVVALLQTTLLLRPNPKDPMDLDPRKARRNRIYRSCGRLIALSIVMVVVEGLLEKLNVIHQPPVPQWTFLWETVAIWAFAVSWLTKAESFAFVRDEPAP